MQFSKLGDLRGFLSEIKCYGSDSNSIHVERKEVTCLGWLSLS